MASVSSRRPNQHHHSASKETDTDPPNFAVILTVVDVIEGSPGEHARGILEVQSAFRQGPRPLLRIIANLHPVAPEPDDRAAIYVVTLFGTVKSVATLMRGMRGMMGQ